MQVPLRVIDQARTPLIPDNAWVFEFAGAVLRNGPDRIERVMRGVRLDNVLQKGSYIRDRHGRNIAGERATSGCNSTQPTSCADRSSAGGGLQGL